MNNLNPQNANQPNPGYVIAQPPPSAGGPLQSASATNRQFSTILAAGATLPIPGTGSSFYFDTLSSQIQARAWINGTPGTFANYVQGTGLDIDPLKTGATYQTLEIFNPNAFAVVVGLRIGFLGFIDNRVILPTQQTVGVTYPTYAAPNTSADILIPDLSNQIITDVNGVKWLAISRSAIRLSNLSNVVQPIYGADGVSVVDEIIGGTAYYLPSAQGTFRVKTAGGNFNGSISETYNAIPPSA
jgi:hypothetical protein